VVTNSPPARLLLALLNHPEFLESEINYCARHMGVDPWQWHAQLIEGIPLRNDLSRRLLRYVTVESVEHLTSVFGFLEELEQRIELLGIHLLCAADSAYPKNLLGINDLPLLLYCQGDSSLLELPQIAIVGSRKASMHGERTAFEFAKQFSQGGFVVTSGLALGIDAAAHRGALAGPGKTIAVMGRSLAEIYPRSNRQLAAQIAANGGLLVSEFAIDMPVIRHNFPRRNRIVTGLCQALLVVEAGLRSGSLVSARLAAEQGKEVGAIPGSIYMPQSEGCLALIKQGAQLVTEPRDVVQTINIFSDIIVEEDLSISDDAQRAYRYLTVEPVSVDFIARKTGWTINKVLSLLCECEVAGIASKRGGQFVKNT